MNTRVRFFAVLVCAGVMFGVAGDAAACWTTYVSAGSRGEFNQDLNDYALILRDAQDPTCRTNARIVLTNKLTGTTPYPNSWNTFLAGGGLSLALAAGLILGNAGELDVPLDNALRDAANQYVRVLQEGCGFGYSTWQNGNTCLEDYGIGSATWGWIAAYRRLTGRDWRTARNRTVSEMQAMLSNITSCIRYNGERGLDPYRGVCNGTLSELAAGTATLISFNRASQNPAYGVGQVTSLGVAAVGLEAAQAPFTSGEFLGEHRTVINALWKEGQAKSRKDGIYATFDPQTCYQLHPGGVLTQDQYCWDPATHHPANVPETGDMTHYRADMFPVKRFYDKYVLFQSGTNDTTKWQFDFQRELFIDEDVNEWSHVWFFGANRREFYGTIAKNWLDARPAMLGRRDYRGGIKRGSYFLTGPSGGSLSANTTTRSKTDPNANWTINDMNGGLLQNGDYVSIRNDAGYYWSATNEGGSTLYANVTWAITWERFQIIKLNDGGVGPIAHGDTFALKTYNNVHYVTAVAGGGVDATGTTVGTNQRFVLDRRIDD